MAGMISVSAVGTLFFFTNLAYVAGVPKEEFKHSGQIIAAVYVQKVFGGAVASKVLPALIAASCVGNIVSQHRS